MNDDATAAATRATKTATAITIIERRSGIVMQITNELFVAVRS
jgi:hypothetical protein